MSTDQPVESSKIVANAIDSEQIRTSAVVADEILPLTISADKIRASEITAVKLTCGAPTPVKLTRSEAAAMNLPGRDEIRSILQSEGAPPRITLDIGGSEDLDGDGLVNVSLGNDGHELVFEDA